MLGPESGRAIHGKKAIGDPGECGFGGRRGPAEMRCRVPGAGASLQQSAFVEKSTRWLVRQAMEFLFQMEVLDVEEPTKRNSGLDALGAFLGL